MKLLFLYLPLLFSFTQINAHAFRFDDECVPVQPLISKNDEVLHTQERLSMFPVPASDWLVLNLTGEAPAGNVDIFHVSGSHVLSQSISGNTVKLNVSQLPVGTYVLKWQPLNGHSVSSIISIQR